MEAVSANTSILQSISTNLNIPSTKENNIVDDKAMTNYILNAATKKNFRVMDLTSLR
jgi:hypothetical protein